MVNPSNILWKDFNGIVRKWIDQKTGDVMQEEQSMIKPVNIIEEDSNDAIRIDEKWIADTAKNIYGNPVDLTVIVKAFESIIVDVAEGKYALEEVTIDTGLFRTVLKLSVVKEPIRTLPLIAPEVLGQVSLEQCACGGNCGCSDTTLD